MPDHLSTVWHQLFNIPLSSHHILLLDVNAHRINTRAGKSILAFSAFIFLNAARILYNPMVSLTGTQTYILSLTHALSSHHIVLAIWIHVGSVTPPKPSSGVVACLPKAPPCNVNVIRYFQVQSLHLTCWKLNQQMVKQCLWPWASLRLIYAYRILPDLFIRVYFCIFCIEFSNTAKPAYN